MCDHQYAFYQDTSYEDWYGNYHQQGEWQFESTYEDLDLHRYHCTQCKKIFYYSQAAANYHEHGIKSDIMGLDS